MKIKVNDQVKIIKGKESGKTGKVVQIFPDSGKVVVEGLNLMKKHLRSRRQGEKGQMVELASPLRLENVALLCAKCNRLTRVGYKLEAGQKKRVCHKCHEFID